MLLQASPKNQRVKSEKKKWVDLAYNHALSDIYSAGCEGLICSDNKGNYDKLKSNH